MEIRVTFKDIIGGSRREGTDCMVARAIKRQRPDLTQVYVHKDHVDFWGPLRPTSVQLPLAARLRIHFWDTWHLVRPFSFDLALPE